MNPIFRGGGEGVKMPVMNTPSSSAMDKWRWIFEQQRRSGLSVARFCDRHRVAESSFFAWKRRLRDQEAASPPSLFVPVTATAKLAGQSTPAMPRLGDGAIELHLGPRRRLVLRPGFDAPTLAAALAVLEHRSAVLEDRPGAFAAGEER